MAIIYSDQICFRVNVAWWLPPERHLKLLVAHHTCWSGGQEEDKGGLTAGSGSRFRKDRAVGGAHVVVDNFQAEVPLLRHPHGTPVSHLQSHPSPPEWGPECHLPRSLQTQAQDSTCCCHLFLHGSLEKKGGAAGEGKRKTNLEKTQKWSLTLVKSKSMESSQTCWLLWKEQWEEELLKPDCGGMRLRC